MENFEKIMENNPVIRQMRQKKEVFWINPHKKTFEESIEGCEFDAEDIEDAGQRLMRFAPLIKKYFPETEEQHGLIESPLKEIGEMARLLKEKYGSSLEGTLLLKEDSHLAIAGSVKARGGIYEVLKHTEDLLLAQGLLKVDENYEKLGEPEIKAFLSQYTIQVGSTGNLGLSIGIISAVLGYHVIVHMSADAREWKKELLRSYGVDVREYQGDYGEAVKKGRSLSEKDEKSYFVDDENSRNLFLGYAVAGKRVQKQLEEMQIMIDEDHPLFVYIPCGVGGAPGGISFGLKQIFKDQVHCFFVEPVETPCMLAGLVSGYKHEICVQDIGLSGKTHADGLAVGRASALVSDIMDTMLSGEMTVQDWRLYAYMKDLLETERIFLEPSACAAFQIPACAIKQEAWSKYLKTHALEKKMKNAVHIVWATGGSLVPESIRKEYIHTDLRPDLSR